MPEYGYPHRVEYLFSRSFDEHFPQDEWRHFALVNNATSLTCSLYVNGVKQGEAAYRNTVTTDDTFHIGGYESLNENFNLNMELDEFRIYTGSLTTKQIEALYLQPNAGVGSTKIEGDQISTGRIKSNNFGPSFGSQFDLTDGTFLMGGSDNPNLSFDGSNLIVSGAISASKGQIAGFNIQGNDLFHGTKDIVVPIYYSRKILKICKCSNKKLIKIKNGEHSLSRKSDLKKINNELNLIIKKISIN